MSRCMLIHLTPWKLHLLKVKKTKTILCLVDDEMVLFLRRLTTFEEALANVSSTILQYMNTMTLQKSAYKSSNKKEDKDTIHTNVLV